MEAVTNIARGVSLACAIVALGYVFVPQAVEEVRGFLERSRARHLIVCRGCGTPTEAPVWSAGVAFCSAECAELHPHHYPEESS